MNQYYMLIDFSQEIIEGDVVLDLHGRRMVAAPEGGTDKIVLRPVDQYFEDLVTENQRLEAIVADCHKHIDFEAGSKNAITTRCFAMKEQYEAIGADRDKEITELRSAIKSHNARVKSDCERRCRVHQEVGRHHPMECPLEYEIDVKVQAAKEE